VFGLLVVETPALAACMHVREEDRCSTSGVEELDTSVLSGSVKSVNTGQLPLKITAGTMMDTTGYNVSSVPSCTGPAGSRLMETRDEH